MIIDTHCHYNLDPLYGENGTKWQTHWQAAKKHGVTHSVVVGTNITTSARALELCRQEPNFRASVGLHPHTIADALAEGYSVTSEMIETWMTHLDEQLKKDVNTKYIAAIGEIGLDFFRLDLSTSEHAQEAELQKYLLIQQLTLADKYLLPVILHVRDTGEQAYTETIKLLKTHKKSNLPFILHCASGSLTYIQEAISMGGYVGVAGNVTYKNALPIRNIVRAVQSDRLLLETDAPYLPPMPYRGKTCEPWMIELTGTYLREECSISLEKVYANTFQVFTTLFIS